MEYSIRDAQVGDMEQVLGLIRQLAAFEKEGDAVEVTVADLQRDGFEKRLFHCFVAEVAGAIVGIALVYPRYSTWKGPVIHLEDLIVAEEMRGKGLGNALLHKVVSYGKVLGVKRICWEVLDWNEPAIKFYEKQGARVMRDWDVVQMDANGMAAFLKEV